MRVGIIALGLIGGSILKALSKHKNIELIAITHNKSTLESAKKYCSICTEDITEVKCCDVVFVCTPISKVLETLDKLENIVNENCTVTDVASVKQFVSEKTYKYNFIGSHPMAGLEVNGFENSVPTLFENAKWVLTPSASSSEKSVQKLKELIEIMGAKTVITTAKEHDEAVAYISHLPMLIAQGLFNCVPNDLSRQLASSGFRDTTRLAATNKTLACDMLNFNRQNIETALENFVAKTKALLNDINYNTSVEKIIIDRKKMYSKEGKNIL